MPRSTILVIDDEPNILKTVKTSLEVDDYAVEVAGNALTVHMIHVVRHVDHFAAVQFPLVAHELAGRNHEGEVAAWNVHFAERRNRHPSDRRLLFGLQHVVEVVKDAQDIGGDLIEQRRGRFGGVHQIEQQLVRAAQRRQDIHAAMQVAVAHQELAFADLKSALHQALKLLHVDVVPVQHERTGVSI